MDMVDRVSASSVFLWAVGISRSINIAPIVFLP